MIWTLTPLLAIACALYWYRRVCLTRAQRTWLYRWLMWYVVPHVRVSVCHTSMTSRKYRHGVMQMRRGDIILTTDNRALSTICVPGTHTHALLCINRSERMCAEMTHSGYGEIHVAKAFFHASRVVILRCPDWDESYIDRVVTKCRSFAGTKYDTQFDLDPDEIYCSELPWQSDVEGRLLVVPSRAWGTGQLVVTPDNLAAANVDVVFDSDEEQP